MKNGTARKGVIFLVPCLLLGLLTLSACDSDSGNDSEEFDGEFTLEQLTFTVGSQLSIDVLADTLTSATLDLLGGSSDLTLEYRIEDESVRRQIGGDFTATDSRVTLNFDGTSAELNQLLLPNQLRLDITEGGSVLEGEIPRSSVDIGRYNETRFGAFNTVDGTLNVRFRQAGAAGGNDG